MKRCWRLSILVFVGVVSRATTASSDEGATKGDQSARIEARDRFDAGLRRFNEGDNSGALAEFKRANDLIANPLVLYNIGLVYAAMNRSVEAVDALDEVLKNPGSAMNADRLLRARRTRDEHAKRIAEVSIKANVPQATIEIDNIDIGRTNPAPATPSTDGPTTSSSLTIKVTSGTHILGAVAVGHAPLRKEITIAGEEKRDVALELVAIEGKIAHLSLRTRLPAADVMIDDERIGRTPVPQSISLVPGRHVIEVRRAGYTSARQEITLGDGAVAELALEPREDRAIIEREGGFLALDATESQAVVTVDGQVRGLYVTPMKLARGEHHLTVERGGFLSMERDFVVESEKTTTVRAQLEPTATTRAEVVGKASTYRTWAWIATLSGAAIAGGGAIFLATNASSKQSAQAEFDRANGQLANHTGVCDIPNGGDANRCNAEATDAKSKLDAARSRDVIGAVTVLSGVAVLGVGVALFVVGENPHKYDRGADVAKERLLVPRAWVSRSGAGLGFDGIF